MESDANILAWIKRKSEQNAAVARTDIRNDLLNSKIIMIIHEFTEYLRLSMVFGVS
jgi:hypothetical protein